MTASSTTETADLPAIPQKRYFTIGEVSELCAVKTHVLRYWEQEFGQLKPVKRRGNRRYYQRHDIELIRRIRNLLYDQGFTIAGARQQLEQPQAARPAPPAEAPRAPEPTSAPVAPKAPATPAGLRLELERVLAILRGEHHV
ncbi:MAG: MerR family transcriptional regulator [Halothiobacillaceae bacterium]